MSFLTWFGELDVLLEIGVMLLSCQFPRKVASSYVTIGEVSVYWMVLGRIVQDKIQKMFYMTFSVVSQLVEDILTWYLWQDNWSRKLGNTKQIYLYCTYMDFYKAYDLVPRSTFFKVCARKVESSSDYDFHH